tara:strand:+ start:1063 stop:2148 length:1086 start_codon:yes stop_codon:yes gene_type:complete
MKRNLKPKLFIPGPTHVNNDILESMSDYPIGHRTPEFSILYDDIVNGLKKILFTKNQIFLCTCSATGLWEAAVRNTVLKRCANFACGAFSKRWHDVTVMCGIKADLIEVELGNPITAEIIDKTLSSGKYDAMTFVHNETSTGVMSPINEVAKIMKNYPDVVFLVDMVSSMSSVKIPIDDLGIDVALASVQKGWAIPPGFSICSVSDIALSRSSKCSNKGYYFDFKVLEKYANRSQTPSTPSIPHLYALSNQLKRINSEGIEARFRRHKDMASIVQSWAKERMSLFPDDRYASTTLTCVENSLNIDLLMLQNLLLEQGYLISGGYGPLKGKTFRISHMGDLMPQEIYKLLGIIDQIIEEINK